MMGMACRISLFDSSERVGEGLCLGQAYTAWCKSCGGEGDLYRGYCPSCWEKWKAPWRGPLFWRSEFCSHTVEPSEKRIKKQCTLCLPWTTSIFCFFSLVIKQPQTRASCQNHSCTGQRWRLEAQTTSNMSTCCCVLSQPTVIETVNQPETVSNRLTWNFKRYSIYPFKK